MMRLEAITAGISVVGASVASALPETEQLEAMAKWPLVLILAAVSIVCVYLMYRGNRENSQDRLQEARMHTDSINKLAEAISASTSKIADKVAAQEALLAQRPCIRDPKND